MVQFKDLQIGDEFFDPMSGDDFYKTSETTAKSMLGNEEDEFNPDEEVIVG